MTRAFFVVLVLLIPLPLQAVTADHLAKVYQTWRAAMIQKNATAWRNTTSQIKQTKFRNRLWSERRRFPDGVFTIPIVMPDVTTLKPVRVTAKGRTAKAVYFGKVDFGVGGKPTDNLMVISFLKESNGWKYHDSEFVNLNGIPDIRKEIQQGKLDYLQQPDFEASGILEKAPRAIKGPAPFIAKAYVFCPGREVKLLVNKFSDHLFQNTKEAEIVIGGAHLGVNEVQYAVKDLPGGKPTAFTIRIYLFSQKPGQKPLKAVEYQFKDGTTPKANGTLRFTLTKEMAAKLR